jgi:heterodisulfide reductase subunit B
MVKSTNNILHKAESRAYTGTTTTRKVIKLIERVLQSEDSKNEGRFKTTYNSLHYKDF